MIQYRGHLYRIAAKAVVYHGSATGVHDEVLRRVLKQGLVPDPPDQVFSTRPDQDVKNIFDQRDVEYQTFGGSYFSNHLETALQYAEGAVAHHGGDRMLVIAQVETRAPMVTIDEDHFISTVKLGLHGVTKAMRKRAATQGDRASDVDVLTQMKAGTLVVDDATIVHLVEKINDDFPLGIPVAKILRYRGLINQLVMLKVELDVKGHEKYADPDGLKAMQNLGVRGFNAIMQEFRQVANQLSLKLKGIADPVEHERRNVRVLDPVGFGGANRILAVLRYGVDDDAVGSSSDPRVYGEVVYDRVPGETNRVVGVINDLFRISSRDRMEWKRPVGMAAASTVIAALDPYPDMQDLLEPTWDYAVDQWKNVDNESMEEYITAFLPQMEQYAKENGYEFITGDGEDTSASVMIQDNQEDASQYIADHADELITALTPKFLPLFRLAFQQKSWTWLRRYTQKVRQLAQQYPEDRDLLLGDDLLRAVYLGNMEESSQIYDLEESFTDPAAYRAVHEAFPYSTGESPDRWVSLQDDMILLGLKQWLDEVA